MGPRIKVVYKLIQDRAKRIPVGEVSSVHVSHFAELYAQLNEVVYDSGMPEHLETAFYLRLQLPLLEGE